MARERMNRWMWAPAIALVLTAANSCTPTQDRTRSSASDSTSMNPLERGEYLVTVAGCHDCHTPGYLYGRPDMKRALAGSDVGWQGPWGVSYAPNLTPDPETGLGNWTNVEIERALRSGVKKDGSPIMPPMPWPDFGHFTPQDMASLIAYLKTLPPVKHRVPARLPPNGTPKEPAITFPAPPEWDVPGAKPATGSCALPAHGPSTSRSTSGTSP